MKTLKIKSVLVCACTLSCLTTFALELEKPTANLTEKYNTDAGWLSSMSPSSNSAAAGWTNNVLAAQFKGLAPLSMPSVQKAFLVGVTNSSDGRFSGDFSKIEEVAFDVQVQNSPSLIFYFKSTTGVAWNRVISGLPANTASGEWVHVSVPMTQSAQWYSYVATVGPVADFVADKASICEFGFEVRRNIGSTYTIDNQVAVDNVMLIGPWGKPLVNGAVPMAWLLENNLNEADAVGDADGDGFSNVAEYLAGTNPNNSNSLFAVEIGRNEQGKTVVKWKDNRYVLFDLFESTNLSAGFTPVEGQTGIQGTGATREVQVDDAAPGAHFYKVQIRPAQ